MRRLAICSFLLSGLVLVGCGSGTDYPQGAEKGSCYPNHTCNAGLTCLSDTCVNASPAGAGGTLGHDGAPGNGGSGPDAPLGNDGSGPDAPLGRDLGGGIEVWGRDIGTSSSGGATGLGGRSGVGGRPVDASWAGTGGVVGSRQLDLVVMVDNSPSMAPKITKMNAQFPKLIAALKDPSDGTLPDLRVAIIDSDLGTGDAYSSGSCGPKTLADGTVSPYGDLGRFQMLTSPTACAFNAGAEFLEYQAGRPVNFTGDINTVFACLASNLGTLGCGEEHVLQAFEFALAAKGVGNEQQQADFLRANAYLGLVFLSDEDDCSAATMDGLFGVKTELQAETSSLRCATRSHMCGGRKLSDSPPGYPTNASFTHAFNDCQPRMGDECAAGTDTSAPTDCNPLKSVKAMAEEIKGLKSDPDNQILVAGIFGWPLTTADLASAQYKIAPIPNPNTADTKHPTVYDYWPVCYDPNYAPSAATTDSSTGFDWTAAAWGATGGLRESAFIEEFGPNGMKFSICQPDFSASMTAFGNAIAKRLPNRGRDGGLADAPMVGPDTGGRGGAGGMGGSGGTGGATSDAGTGGGNGADGGATTGAFQPLCSGLLTAAGVAPTKNGICVDTDPQLCYKTCGPESLGFKSETCTAGVYVEQSGCSFLSGVDYSCYKIPTTIDASCPTTVPQASTVCNVAPCTPCNVNGGFLDSSGAAKTGYCVCPTPSATTGTSKWSCAVTTAWPCPAGKGC